MRFLLLIGMLLAAPAAAGEWKNLLVVSFSGVEELQADVGFLGQMTQNRELGETIGKLLSKRSGIEKLDGIDRGRPWGLVVQTDGLRVTPLVFVPVSDAAELLKSLQPVIGEPEPVAAGLWKIGSRTLTGYVRAKEGWAYVGQSEETLERLPDPVAVLGDLPKRYDLAITFAPAHLPEALRTLAIDQLREDGKLAPGGDLLYRWLEDFFTDVRQATLGWTLDRQSKLAALELTLTPTPGSKAGPRWQAQQALVNSLRGSPESVTALDVSLSFKGGAQVGNDLGLSKLLERTGLGGKAVFADALVALLADAARSEPAEAAVRIHGKSPPFAIVAAARLSDPTVVERQIDKLSQAADGSSLRVKKDVAQQGSLRVHALELAGAKEETVLKKLLGDDATIYVATSGQHVFVACGQQALPAIEKSLPGKAVEALVVQFSLRLGSVLSAVSRVTDNQSLVPVLTLLGLSLQSGDDRVLFSVETSGEQARARLEARESLLRSAAFGLSIAVTRMLEEQNAPAIRPRQNP